MDPVSFVILLLVGVAVLGKSSNGIPASGWVWPMPTISVDGQEYRPVISSGWGTPRAGVPSGHRGVDILYRRKSVTDRQDYPSKGASGSAMFFCPAGVPVFAARDGVIWSTSKTSRGYAVVIDHGKPWASFYQHLSQVVFPGHARGVGPNGKPTQVKAGDIIGIVGGDPSVPPHLRHLHFALWEAGTDASAVDPEQAMGTWPRMPWTFKATQKG